MEADLNFQIFLIFLSQDQVQAKPGLQQVLPAGIQLFGLKNHFIW